MIHLHFIHGFLGLPRDWSPLLLELKGFFGERAPQFHMHNLWKDMESLPDPSLNNWALRFVQKLPPSGNVLIGYSMGGRLAMHFPTWEQPKIKGMILIGAHPGLILEQDKQQRLEEDRKWVQKFLESPWEQVVQEWNSQPIFRNDRMRSPRQEGDFSRHLLSKALTHWSLAQQENMTERLRAFQFPIYYIHGDKDEKFTAVAKNLKERIPKINVCPVFGGHTPHISNPKDIVTELKSFFTGLSSK